ncbi:MAG: bifunctional serine/threonine-protein kinase/universal stress protein [Proteobacteria bacterium]|nr:bifunctional serine/threonine-protein kinase/universal stress protein [Pseudomonadota bacterium]
MVKAHLQTGTVIDGFVVGELLHKGGMARLWKVTRQGADEPLLMKVPVLQEGEDPAAIVSFEMEQMILPRLKGPHVPRFVANGGFDRQPYVVMEQIAGTSLLPMLESLPRKPEEVAGLAEKIAVALDSLHGQRVVHLDIKPSNIMFRPSGEAVIIDYGLSRHLDLPDLMAEEFRLPYGTAPYMAPEQVLGIRHDTRSDLFALGVLMYFFATGERPFGDPQRLKGLQRRIWDDPQPPRLLNPAIHLWLQEIILRCLEVNAARRYPSASQLRFDLLHPSQVTLTKRAHKERRDSFFERLRRKSEPLRSLVDHPPSPAAGLAQAPIVAIAIDLDNLPEDVSAALRQTAQRIIERTPESRIACLNVQKLSRITIDQSLDEEGHSRHVQRIVKLQHWARGLGLAESRLSFHVLEALDPAEAILDYARANTVDHILIGARDNSAMRKFLGSVSGRVAAEAPCTVTVARSRKPQL